MAGHNTKYQKSHWTTHASTSLNLDNTHPDTGSDMTHANVTPKARKNARGMRKAMTDAEVKLWNALRAHRLMGIGFRRQLPILGYIADFACPDHKVIVEVDGAGHSDDGQIGYDRDRDETLVRLGWTVLRFSNEEVMRQIDDVCTRIVRTVGVGAFE